MTSCTLSQNIQQEYERLIQLVNNFQPSLRTLKAVEGTGGKVSIAEIIAYQIGWGKCVICWYETGIKGEIPEMPGDGFSNWNYTAIAKHFYKKYLYDSSNQQMRVFHEVVLRILEIIQIEHETGNLDKVGVWPWCTLSSGKEWPLSKWIQVNTVSPYKRAAKLIKNYSLVKIAQLDSPATIS